MDLAFTPEQDLFRDTVRGYFDRLGVAYVRGCDAAHEPPYEAFREMGRMGWLGINTPETHGGAGGSTVDLAILLEECGRGFLDLALWVFRVVSHGAHAVAAFGTKEQQDEYLPRVARGEVSPAFALTEPEAGSDAASITTRARREGDSYVINGQKIYCSGFKVSDFVLTAVRTDKGSRKHDGISTLIVPTDASGLTATPIETLGNWPLGTTMLYFDDVRVPVSNLLGEEGQGWSILMDLLEYERLCLSAARTGAAGAVLEATITYVQQRHQFGRPIGSFQAVSHMVAEMQVLVETSRMHVYRYAERLDAGRATTRDAAMVKLYCAEAYKQVADLGMQCFGGLGYTMEHDIQRHYRESRLGTIGGGTSEIQRNIIARTLGL